MKRLDSLIRDALDDFEPDINLKRNRTLLMWRSVAGEDLGSLSVPEGFEGSVLIVRVMHPAASMELRLRRHEILSLMNSMWDEEIFTEIRTVSRSKGRRSD